VQTVVDKITEGVKAAAHRGGRAGGGGQRKNFIPKNPWFDSECEAARRKSFKLLKLFRRANSLYVKQLYLDANRQFINLKRLKRKIFNDKLKEDLKKVTNTKQFWKAAKFFKLKSNYVGANITIEDWVRHFHLLLNPPINAQPVLYAEPSCQNEFLDKEITITEVKRVLSRAANNKAPGFDRVSMEFYKNAPDALLEIIVKLFNKIFESGEVPKSFKKSIVYPLHKKGDANNVSNYRGISFMDSISKVFTGVILDRIEKWVSENNILNEYQAGFLKGYSTVDNIFNLMCMVNLRGV